MNALTHYFRDPISGLTHLLGVLLGLVGLVFLPHTAAYLVFGLSLVGLYAASSAYHLLKVPDGTRLMLRRLDHSMVAIFIAGSYTPFCVIGLNSPLGYGVLATVWALALGALVKTFYWVHAPRWITAGIYVLMGWVVVIAIYPLAQALTSSGLQLLFGGGIAYTVGAVIYATKWPDPWPPHFGFHEVWHLFVLAGSAFHYAAVLTLVTSPT